MSAPAAAGGLAAPDRRVIFDINDFDETHPAPFEWDLKRLAASFVIASRNNGHKRDKATDAARESVLAYAEKLQALARSYAELMQQRFGAARVQLRWDIGALPPVDVPALSLQPLLENTFVRAVQPRSALTTIRIGVHAAGSRVTIRVADDGPGPAGGPGAAHGSGVGLANLRERLHALYGGAASLRLLAADGGGCVAVLELPGHG